MKADVIDRHMLTQADLLQLYVRHTRPLLNREALFADQTKAYCDYTKDETGYRVNLHFRTGRDNVDSVTVVTDTREIVMRRKRFDRLFDYYEAVLHYPECGTAYEFRVTCGRVKLVYNQRGSMYESQAYYNFRFQPDFTVPDWARGAVMYQIFTDRFCNGDPSNDVVDDEYAYLHQHAVREKDWSCGVRCSDVCHFYGGDLQGIMDKLDYLQSLGVEVLYLNPIFVSPSTHKYDTQDYDHIDPHFGRIVDDGGAVLDRWDEDNRHAERFIRRVTSMANLEASDALFAELTAEIHRRGMRIILDGVFNHCGSFNKWLDGERIYENQEGYAPGAYVSWDSPYRDFFRFRTGNWPYNSDYLGWWGHVTLPKLNYEDSEKLCEYILKIAVKWVQPPYNVDGWRLDVAADLGHSEAFNHQFWKRFREAVKAVRPDALILAEHYSDPLEWLDGSQWDTVMNYQAFMEPVTWFLTGMEKHSDEERPDLLNNFEAFQTAMSHHMSRLPEGSLQTAMNELSNHDHSRFLTRTNGIQGRLASKGAKAASKNIRPAVMREAVIMQMTWPGAPTVYYGDEAGMCGWTDPDNRRTYPWGYEDQMMVDFHREVIRIHNESSALRTGSFKMLGGEDGILMYGRFDEKERFVIAVNNNAVRQDIRIPVWQIGCGDGDCLQRLLFSAETGVSAEQMTYQVKAGCLSLAMPKKSGVILKEITKSSFSA